MLPVRYRLKKRKTFNYLHQHGKRQNGTYVVVYFCTAAHLKVGFSASKKVGNSVVRHRSARLMREAMRPLLSRVNPRTNLIVVAKPDLPKQHLLYITLDLENTLKKAGLML
ncbi:MAG: ribonuclease P protein component [Clostridia bacterium]|nr:ribonuclease P protein component [Clostridia bacterium]